MSTEFSVTNETRGKTPRISFGKMKDAILGKKYELSLVFTTATRIKKLNYIYRGKNKSTDILSFSISENVGEIYISLADAKKEAKKFDRELTNFVSFLFIHGAVHLKGYDHGGTMVSIEAQYRKRFGV